MKDILHINIPNVRNRGYQTYSLTFNDLWKLFKALLKAKYNNNEVKVLGIPDDERNVDIYFY